LYISHKLDEVYHICDRATVLRDGAYIGTFPMAGLPKERLIRSMVGRDVAMFAKRHRPRCVDWQDVVLRVRNASGNTGFQGVSFDLHRGEILGFFGLVGAGRTETMRGVFGADRLTSGVIELHGRQVTIKSPADATAHRIGLAPENRKTQGFVKVLNNLDNIALASLDRFQIGLFQSHRAKAVRARQIGEKVNLTPNDPAFFTVNLSGGNQQKVVVAKWLTTD
ncbi:MAG: ATP-binding cassette domain-containing protein, partial [Caldilinea sp.]